MNFQLPVSTIMTAPVECVNPQQKILDLKHLYEKRNFHRHIPVTEKGVLVGMVSLVDYMRAIGDATLDDNEPVYSVKTVADIMSHDPVSVSEETSISEAGALLAKGEFSSVVITRDNCVTGIVTATDLIRYFLQQQD
ncbi:MAG: CBS domain-containing protein [Bacteroidota bacterium]